MCSVILHRGEDRSEIFCQEWLYLVENRIILTLSCFGGKRYKFEDTLDCLQRCCKKEMDWVPKNPTKQVEFYVNNMLLAWFYEAEGPESIENLKFNLNFWEGHRYGGGVWCSVDDPRLADYHKYVLEAWKNGEKNAHMRRISLLLQDDWTKADWREVLIGPLTNLGMPLLVNLFIELLYFQIIIESGGSWSWSGSLSSKIALLPWKSRGFTTSYPDERTAKAELMARTAKVDLRVEEPLTKVDLRVEDPLTFEEHLEANVAVMALGVKDTLKKLCCLCCCCCQPKPSSSLPILKEEATDSVNSTCPPFLD